MSEMPAPNIFRPDISLAVIHKRAKRPYAAKRSELVNNCETDIRAGHLMDVFLGLKPQAESFCPFGAETKCSEARMRARRHQLGWRYPKGQITSAAGDR